MFIASAADTDGMWWIAIMASSMQGMHIFVTFGFNKKVRNMWKNNKDRASKVWEPNSVPNTRSHPHKLASAQGHNKTINNKALGCDQPQVVRPKLAPSSSRP